MENGWILPMIVRFTPTTPAGKRLITRIKIEIVAHFHATISFFIKKKQNKVGFSDKFCTFAHRKQ